MGFEKIPTVEKYEFYIDVAFRSANKRAGTMALKQKSQIERKREIELSKILTVREVLESQLSNILESFPQTDQLTEFYKDLISITIGLDDFKNSLGAVGWAKRKIKDLFPRYNINIKRAGSVSVIESNKKEFYGRVNSVLKQIKDSFDFLAEARKQLLQFPVIKSRLFTVAISGFPNVGKSTLLNKISGAKPEVAAYPFTTKGLMMGVIKIGDSKIQMIDTPGTLNRFNKMNDIEKLAWLAMKHVTHLIVYIFDLTEPYPIAEQEKLFEKIKETGKPVLVYLSKTDILEEDKVKEFRKGYKNAFVDANKLKEDIIKRMPEEETEEEKE